ncbi:bifunctional phosphoribosylaminoimidazolecarboxamide formyltransferase/IMP cyclohydrolase [Jannaschia sp. R86511]|uniref:bifunctional phosphoribosylaminoimidazolecarboxamide formyltransferase/IMP cyclohydrolase n=1 Tax=Jannaschia sp. R86511 TaxID=3093853 RepID=UPI0036D31E80
MSQPTSPSETVARPERRPVRRALVSVYDKTGLEDLAARLHAAGVEIVSTGSTAARVAAAGVPVTGVEQVTGFPECLDGRVKTLHPGVHAGLLADSRRPEHVAQVAELGIDTFDLVVVNLYPFAATVASGAAPDQVVEQIDIGGPAMVRSSAKNHPSVAVVVDPARYDDVVAAVTGGGFTLAERTRLAADAFAHTAAYDVAVATWFAEQVAAADQVAADRAAGDEGPAERVAPAFTGTVGTLVAGLRYGENPHQQAAVYAVDGAPGGLASAQQLHGKAMSYNNFVDTDAAVRAAHDHEAPAVAIIKHANPCGIAVASAGAVDDIADAHARAHACDPVSAFGGVVAANRPVTRAMAEQLAEVFTEVVVAPAFDDDALAVLTAKKNVRLLVVPAPGGSGQEWRRIDGGLLVQQVDRVDAAGDDPSGWTLAAGEALDEAGLADAVFAWRAVRAVKSNAILLAQDGASVGIGMGQVNRVDSCRLAVTRAGEERARGSVAASDAFFPFADGVQVMLDAGVRTIVQPGGSVRDAEVVAAVEAAGATMYLTGVRHFAH